MGKVQLQLVVHVARRSAQQSAALHQHLTLLLRMWLESLSPLEVVWEWWSALHPFLAWSLVADLLLTPNSPGFFDPSSTGLSNSLSYRYLVSYLCDVWHVVVAEEGICLASVLCLRQIPISTDSLLWQMWRAMGLAGHIPPGISASLSSLSKEHNGQM